MIFVDDELSVKSFTRIRVGCHHRPKQVTTPVYVYTVPGFGGNHHQPPKPIVVPRDFRFASQYNGTVIGNLKAELNSVYPREFRYFA